MPSSDNAISDNAISDNAISDSATLDNAILSVENLSKAWDRPVLCNLSFALQPGSFVAVLGQSGAGKSTLLRCLVQLTPCQGRVWFRGSDLTRCSPAELRRRRREIAVIAQQFNLVRRHTALANCLGGRLPELPLWRCLLRSFPRPLQAEAIAALDRVQLLDFAWQRADRLSGGQQQRVAIARALTQRARLILADEPVASLDPHTARAVLGLLKSLCVEEGLAVLCNLHQVELARAYSDRILGIRDGRLVVDAPTASVTAAHIARIYGERMTPGG